KDTFCPPNPKLLLRMWSTVTSLPLFRQGTSAPLPANRPCPEMVVLGCDVPYPIHHGSPFRPAYAGCEFAFYHHATGAFTHSANDSDSCPSGSWWAGTSRTRLRSRSPGLRPRRTPPAPGRKAAPAWTSTRSFSMSSCPCQDTHHQLLVPPIGVIDQ